MPAMIAYPQEAEVRQYDMKLAEVILRGGIVELDATPEVVAAIGTDPDPILGIALHASNVDPFPTKMLVALADSEKARFWFSGTVDPVAANVNASFGVIKDADKKGVIELAGESASLAAAARDKKLAMDAMQGATFTISSLGGIGGRAFTPIVNAPEVAILGVSRSKIEPVLQGDTFVPRTILPLSLSYDHRAIDGAEAARFTTHLTRVLSDFRRVVL